MATIKDVAKLAGVSVATVSRYLSGASKLTGSTEAKVKGAIETLNYRPNIMARSLSQSRSGMLMVLVSGVSSPFISSLLSAFSKPASARGYKVLLAETSMDQKIEATYIEALRSRLADGFVQLSAHLHPEMLDEKHTIPFVNVCECLPDATYPTVQIDDRRAARQITEFLISLGHRDIACLVGLYNDQYRSPVTVQRLDGFRDALDENNIEFHAEWMLQGDYTTDSGVQAAQTIAEMERRPSAVFCASDTMAIGLIRGLANLGINVPEDISVTGFDDIEMAKYTVPSLTTIRQPVEKIANAAINNLIDIIEEKAHVRQHVTIEHELILRGSTRRL